MAIEKERLTQEEIGKELEKLRPMFNNPYVLHRYHEEGDIVEQRYQVHIYISRDTHVTILLRESCLKYLGMEIPQ